MRFLHRIFNLHVHIVFEVLKPLAEFAQGVVDVVEQHGVGFAVQGAHVEAGTEQFLLEAQPGGVDDGPAHPDDEVRFGADRLAVLFDIDFLKGLDLWEGDIDGDGDIDRDDVLAVTKDTARDIFKRHFWDRPRAGEMPPLVAVCFYDFAVNAGVPRAARMLQGLLRVEADGIVGRNTLTAAESCNQRELASFMLLERERWYRGLVAKKPKSAAFLRGWLNRTSDCRALVERLASRWGIVE